MIRDLLNVFLLLAAALLVYRYHRAIIAAFRRFDARNVQRIAEQERAKTDPLAHFRETLKTAEEQVETVSEVTVSDERLGTPVTRYVFEGERFATRDEAERVRAEKIRAIARSYYVDLPRALAERRAPESVRGAASSNPPKPSPQNPPPQDPGSNVVPLRRGNETLH